MEQSYCIYADISADLPRELIREQDIRFIPMSYTLGGEDRVCTQIEEDEVLKQFYEGQRNGDVTQTSQISPQTYIELFAPILEKGQSVLYLSLSSGLSGTYNSSCIAAAELAEKYTQAKLVCVDSLSATSGIGMLLELAAENRARGLSIDDNAADLREKSVRVCHWFTVDDLMYLKRGGRISAATAFVGTALNLKPMLKVTDEGTLVNIAKARGSKAAMNQLLAYYDAASNHPEGERVYVVHADSPDAAGYLKQEILERCPTANITVNQLNPIIGAHTGPGVCAIVHFGDRNAV